MEKEEETSLLKKLKECEKLKNEYLKGWQRSRADLLNYKKEEIGRLEEVKDFQKIDLILKILRIFDNLEKAESHLPDDVKDSEWAEGFSRIKSQFREFLKEEGIEEVKAEGENFNPELHEAVEEVEVEERESGTIVEVLEKGYSLNGQLLRPAKVKVVK